MFLKCGAVAQVLKINTLVGMTAASEIESCMLYFAMGIEVYLFKRIFTGG